jgi:hypothetical protein
MARRRWKIESPLRFTATLVLDEVLQRFPEWDVDLDRARFMSHADNRGYESLPITMP